MSIRDVWTKVVCDGVDTDGLECEETVDLEGSYSYAEGLEDYAEQLERHGWICDGWEETYCCEECQREAAESEEP